jgi:GTPase
LINKTIDVYEKWNKRITTGKMNKFLEGFLKNIHIPERATKIHYITQVKTRPPTFAIFITKGNQIEKNFERKLINSIREEFGLEGIPFRILQRYF